MVDGLKQLFGEINATYNTRENMNDLRNIIFDNSFISGLC